MSTVRRTLAWLGIASLAMVSLFLVNLVAHRWLGPGASHAAALALLAFPNDTRADDGNVFALMWTMRHAVPDSQIESIAAEDVREAEARLADGRPLAGLVADVRPLLEAPDDNDPGLCPSRERGCLTHVRADHEAARSLVAKHGRWIQRMARLEGKDYYRLELPMTIELLLTHPGPAQRIRLSALALRWSEGDRHAALSDACRNAGAWRRLRHDTNLLIASMLTVAYLESRLDPVAHMLAELPDADAVAAECRVALAPIDKRDVSICSEMRSEFAFMQNSLKGLADARQHESLGDAIANAVFVPLIYSDEQHAAWFSPTYAVAGTELAQEEGLADRPIITLAPEISPTRCASALANSILAHAAMSDFREHHERLLDSAARLRLAATVLWLRDTRENPRNVAGRFAERPDVLRSATRASGIDADGRSIWVDNLHDRRAPPSILALAPESRSVR